MDVPTELFVRPLQDDTSLVAFQFPFQLEAKALDAAVLTEEENGDILIEGLAVSFAGIDRENENFLPGSLQEGLKAFIEGGAPLCFHHKHDQVLGKVLEMEEVKGGVRAKARIDGAIKKHPVLGTIYEQVKNGTLASFSLGGFFKRIMTPDGPRIAKVDPTELSITAVPVMATGTQFSVIAGKALENFTTDETTPAQPPVDAPLDSIDSTLDQLGRALDAIEGKAAPVAKGSHHDHRALATVIALHQLAQPLPDSTASDTDSNGNPPVHPKVAELGEGVRKDLHKHAKRAHELAAKLGPLPADAGYNHLAH